MWEWVFQCQIEGGVYGSYVHKVSGVRPFEHVWFGSVTGHHLERGWSCSRLVFLPLDVKMSVLPGRICFGLMKPSSLCMHRYLSSQSIRSQLMPGPDWRKGRRLEEEGRLIALVHEAFWLGLRKGMRRMFCIQSFGVGQSFGKKIKSYSGLTASRVWRRTVTATDWRWSRPLSDCVCGKCVRTPHPGLSRGAVAAAGGATESGAPRWRRPPSPFWLLITLDSRILDIRDLKILETFPFSTPESKLIWKMLAKILIDSLKSPKIWNNVLLWVVEF